MSYASDALLKNTAAKVAQLEQMLAALKYKVDALEQLTIPRPVFRSARDKKQAEVI